MKNRSLKRVCKALSAAVLTMALCMGMVSNVAASELTNVSENNIGASDNETSETKQAKTGKSSVSANGEMETFEFDITMIPLAHDDSLQTEGYSEAKQTILDGMLAHAQTINLAGMGISYDQAAQIIKELLLERGDLYYISGIGGGTTSGGQVISIWLRYEENWPAVGNAIKEAVREVIKPGMNDLQKALALHDWLCRNCSYDYAGMNGAHPNAYTAYGALVEKTAVCQGYAYAYFKLALYAGLNVAYARGGDHVWNVVQINGSWYNVDCTWDGQPDSAEVLHDNFMKSRSAFNSNHTIASSDYECTSTLYDNGGYWYRRDNSLYNAPFYFENGAGAFHVGAKNGKTCLLYYNEATGSDSVVQTFGSSLWRANQGGNSWVQAPNMGQMVIYNDALYISDPYNVYKVTNSGKTVEKVYSYNGTDKVIYSLTVEGQRIRVDLSKVSYQILDHGYISLPEKQTYAQDVTAFVKRLYNVCLSRDYDSDGLSDWTGRLSNQSETASQVAMGFFFSEEFTNKNCSNEQFVDTLYRTMFGREADEGGKAGWLNLLENGMSRIYVYHGFAESTEFSNLCNSYGVIRGSVTLTAYRDQNPGATGFMARLYTKMLGRAYDDGGIEYWCQEYLSGSQSIEAIVNNGFLHSQELQNMNLSNEEFVTRMYRTLLNREPDAAGKADWVGRLNRGEENRDTLVYGFTLSREFAEIKASYGL